MRAGFLLSAVLLAMPVAREAQTPTSGETIVRGVVFDSLRMRPLADAQVQIAATTGTSWFKTYVTGSDGTFELTDVPNGSYLIGFFHPELDSLGLLPPTFRLDVQPGPPIHMQLAVPSARRITRALCGGKGKSDSTGLFLGFLRSADDSMPRPNATVVIRWAELVIQKHSISRHIAKSEVSSGRNGLVAVCGLPLDTPVMMQGASASDSSGAFEITLPSSGFYHRDIFVGQVTRTSAATSDSAPSVALLRGSGRVRGHVTGVTGRPISGARVTVWGTGVEMVTNADGAFALGTLPGGTHTLEVRAVGFAPARQPVDIVPGSQGAAEVELTNLGIILDTVKVTAQRVYVSRRLFDFERRMRMGFERRKRTGMGRFIDEEEIERRKPTLLTDLLRSVPGVYVEPSVWGGDDVLMRGNAGLGLAKCRPDLIIDGSRLLIDETYSVNSLVWANEVRAVEVYSQSLSVPAEFQSVSGCGALVIWTGSRRK